MYEAVLDASTLIAYLKEELPDNTVLDQLIPKSIISTVNACEVATVLTRIHMPINEINELIEHNIGKIIPIDQPQAMIAADLWQQTKHLGLSLGDRACLALGQIMQLPIYTADRIWSQVKIDGVEVRLIR